MFLGQIGCAVQAVDYALILLLTRHTFRDPARENNYMRTVQSSGGIDCRLNGCEKPTAITGVHRTNRGRLILFIAGYLVDPQAERLASAGVIPLFPFRPLAIFLIQFYRIVACLSNPFR